eukprot:2634010-Pleurochrysis_carterae.AAC.1
MVWRRPPEPPPCARRLTYAPPPTNMHSVAEVAALLATPEAPTDLVACEFSGAVRDALLASGRRALSCD